MPSCYGRQQAKKAQEQASNRHQGCNQSMQTETASPSKSVANYSMQTDGDVVTVSNWKRSYCHPFCMVPWSKVMILSHTNIKDCQHGVYSNNTIDSSQRWRWDFSDTCTTKTCHDLANRFDIAASIVSRIFQKWLDNMYSKLGFLITWPKREVVCQNLPLDFKSLYLNCCCIIDCSEIFIKMSASFSAHSKT